MPVRINLLSEVIAAEAERRNDPVKRAIWVGAFGVFLVLLWYSTLIFEQMVVSSNLTEKKSAWARMEPSNKELKTTSDSIRESVEKITALDRLATNRFLWAPVLNALQYTMVGDRIQLVRLSGSQTYEIVMPPKEKKSRAAKKKKEKPATSTEKTMLTLDARDFGAQEQQNFKAFIAAIGRSDYFKSNLESGGLHLAKLLPPTQQSGNADKSYTQFTIECKFPAKERK